MTKSELVDQMAEGAGLSKKAAGDALNAMIDSITKTLKKKADNKVTITGFGTFSVAKRKARKGRNPQTGEELKIKAGKSPKFTPGKAFKDAIK